jgi:hypothetical protein
MIENEQAPISGSPNAGRLFVKQFAESDELQKPLPQAKINQAIEALKAKLATESLTRAEPEDFLRETFPGFRIATRQFRNIFEAIPAPKGRPRKSDA